MIFTWYLPSNVLYAKVQSLGCGLLPKLEKDIELILLDLFVEKIVLAIVIQDVVNISSFLALKKTLKFGLFLHSFASLILDLGLSNTCYMIFVKLQF